MAKDHFFRRNQAARAILERIADEHPEWIREPHRADAGEPDGRKACRQGARHAGQTALESRRKSRTAPQARPITHATSKATEPEMTIRIAGSVIEPELC